jgi:uncharacterized protein YpmS
MSLAIIKTILYIGLALIVIGIFVVLFLREVYLSWIEERQWKIKENKKLQLLKWSQTKEATNQLIEDYDAEIYYKQIYKKEGGQ